MFKLNKKALGMAVVLAALLAAGCEAPKPKSHYKYTVWVGSSVVAVGYYTQSYETTEDGVRFKTKEGKTKIVPTSSLYTIDEN